LQKPDGADLVFLLEHLDFEVVWDLGFGIWDLTSMWDVAFNRESEPEGSATGMLYRPRRLVIEQAVAERPLVHRIRAALPDVPLSLVDRIEENPTARGPDVLEIVAFRGRFIKPCPGTRFYTCCGYQILHLGTQCPLGCSYCILQAYFASPCVRLFANLEDMWQQLEEHLRRSPRPVHRIGTGEFTDSLLLDPVTRMSEELVPFFANRTNAVLELKTKTDHVHRLEGLDHRGRTIVAWSLNPPAIASSEESGAATLEERLTAARRCQQWGYRLAFHFDPLVAYPGWRQGYAEVVNRLFSRVHPGRVAWISLGTLRYMPSLKAIIRQRHPWSRILGEEFVPGLDGKMRYFRDLRVEMYRHLGQLLREVSPDLCIYLCMESEDIWREALGFAAAERGGLPAMLDRQVLA
jgi:spore photoproduct lyase